MKGIPFIKTMEYDDDGKINVKTTYYDKNDKETKSDNYINEAFEWVAKPSVRDGRIVGTVKNISNQSRSAEISFVLITQMVIKWVLRVIGLKIYKRGTRGISMCLLTTLG